MHVKSAIINLAIVYSMFCIGFSAVNVAAQTNIQTTGSSFVFLEKKIGVIEFKLKASGANATKAENILLNNLKKIAISKESTLKVVNKRFIGASSDPKQLTSGSPIQVIYDIILLTPISSTSNVLDLLLSNSDVQIIKFSTKTADDDKDLQLAYSHAVANAKEKAEQIAKSNNLVLGKMLEVNISEEAPPSSIRAQLENNSDEIDSGPRELRIFANIRFEFENIKTGGPSATADKASVNNE